MADKSKSQDGPTNPFAALFWRALWFCAIVLCLCAVVDYFYDDLPHGIQEAVATFQNGGLQTLQQAYRKVSK